MATAVATDLIADALAARREELVVAAVEDVRGRASPAYREAGPRDRSRTPARHTERAPRPAVRRPAPRPARDSRASSAFVERHAARRARRGIALGDFLAGVPHLPHDRLGRGARRVAREPVRPPTRRSRRRGDRDRLRRPRRDHAASAAYLDAQQLLLADGDRVRRDLLEDLLEAGEPADGGGLAAARAAGLEADARCVLVAAVAAARRTTTARCRARRARWPRPCAAADEPLAVTRHGEIVLVRALRAGRAPAAARAARARPASERRREGVVLAVGVSTVQRGSAALGAAYREASQALRRVADRRRRALAAGPERVRVPDAARRRRRAAADRARIERFVAEDRAHGGHLIDTLLAYAEADLNAKAAAEALLIHVNTAHYRLGRIAEKTGCDLRRLADVIDLLIAVRLTVATAMNERSFVEAAGLRLRVAPAGRRAARCC